MDTREFNRIDLNLLIALQVLLEEKNVSRAAQRLFITQPAMSKTLNRLRTLFEDELFTRSSHGMQPTPRAMELTTKLNGIVGDIAQLLAGNRFDPGAVTGEISLALSEHIAVTLLPRLLQRLSTRAPRLRVKVITRIENQLEELALGHLDFAIHVRQAQYGPDYRVEDLGGSPVAILVRTGHPLVNVELSEERLAQFPLIKLYATSRELEEVQRQAIGMLPDADHPLATLEISHLLTALEVLRQTDYFMPAPTYLLQQASATAGITGLPLPRANDLSIHSALVAHKRTLNSPLHNWFWEQIVCTINELRTPLERKLRQRVTAGSAHPQT
jgi:DNA-binding transcriptional LysR family regulator